MLAAVTLSGCAGGSSIDYLRSEYGSRPRDGQVNIGTVDEPSIYQIWIHASKPKINVQTSVAFAGASGALQGATLNVVNVSPVQPTFEKAAHQWFADKGEGPCRLSNPMKIHDLVWEFDYDCSPQPAPPAKRRKNA